VACKRVKPTYHCVATAYNTQYSNMLYRFVRKIRPIPGPEGPDGGGGSGIALLIRDLCARRGGWSAPRPGRFTPGKDPVPIVQEAGWAPGPVWKCAKNLAPHLDSIPGPSSL
jgi:hypothetical protein